MHVANTTPYPWPFDGELAAPRVALVVVGWTADWWRRCANPAIHAANVEALAAASSTVLFVETLPPRSPGTNGDTSDGRPTGLAGTVVSAAGIDGFFGGPLDAVLRAGGHDHLLLAGLGLETTVHSTMRSANDRGYECLLVVDACAPHDPSGVQRAVSMIEMSGGIFGAVGDTLSVLVALRGGN